MKHAARLQATIDILELIILGKQPADQITSDYFKERRYAGSKDRREIQNTVYDILRNRAQLMWLCDHAELDSQNARHLCISYCIKEEILIDPLFVEEQYAPSPLTDEEREAINVLSHLDPNNAPIHVKYEYPLWLEEDFIASFGDEYLSVIQALNQEASMDLRVNPNHPFADQVIDILAQQNIAVHQTPYVATALRCEKKVKLGGIKAFKEGLIDVQDEGSQLIAHLCTPQNSEIVIDFCAGAGGKTLALGALMQNGGHIYALDISSKRLYKMRPRLERAGLKNVILNPIRSENDPWLKQFESRADRVLVDAPCTGIGAWRRNPESRWKLTPDLLEDVLKRQHDILRTAAHLIKPDGQLIYATCSILKRENEEQIEKFLAEHSDFTIKPIPEIWHTALKSGCPFDGNFMNLRPDLHRTDGFFCAVLERKK